MRPATLLLTLALFAGNLSAQRGVPDPVFRTVPFDDWLAERRQDPVNWSLQLLGPSLSLHQRLVAQVQVAIKAKELAQFDGHRELIVFVQLTDAAGDRYQSHGTIDLKSVRDRPSVESITYRHAFFVRPGEYRADAGILDAESRIHSVRTERFRVSAIKRDPLPDSCRNCPPIEFLSSVDPPDMWYLPEAGGRLNLDTKPSAPVTIDIIGNLSPSERFSGSLRVRDRLLSLLIPSLKTLSQIDCTGCSMNAALVDLYRRRVAFQAAGRSAFKWARLRPTLADTDTATIDVNALKGRAHAASYLVSQVQKRIQPRHVVIVISRPVDFDTRQEAGPADPAATSDYRLFYIRLLPPPLPPRVEGIPRERRVGGGRGPAFDRFDSLVPLLKPLGPRVFDVESAEQMRKALAAILDEINKM